MKLSKIIRNNILQFIFVFLSFSLMGLISYLFVSRNVKKQIFEHAREMLQTAETTLRMDFRDTEVPLIIISRFIDDKLKAGWTESDLRSYLVWTTEALSSKEVNIPGFFNLFCYIDGKFLSGRKDWTPPEDYDPRVRPWYIAAESAAGGVGYSSLYRDFITGELVVSLARTMEIRGETVIIGIDLDLRSFFGYIRSLQSETGGYGLLMDQHFSLLFHVNDEYLGRQMEALSPRHADFVRNLKANSNAVVVQQLPNWKGVNMVLVSKRLFNNWYLAVATPVISYYKDVYSMALILSILGVVFMITLSIILVQLNLLRARSDEESHDKSSFLAKMSHEIRTPMNSILGMAELIQRKAIPGEIREYINIISQSGNTLLTIINDILDFSKIDSGRLTIEERNYHLAPVINDILNAIRPRITEKNLDFFVEAESKLPMELMGDDVRIRQVLINLLSNAVKYTRTGFVSLQVSAEVREKNSLKLLFEVRDSGIGIKPDDIDRLFNEFSRVDTRQNQGIEGTGLGLVITRALCRAMGGDVTVESVYGEGSVFRATVVQGYYDDRPIARVVSPENKRILFYDWRPRHTMAMIKLFKELGLSAECAPNIQSFLKSLEDVNYNYAFISSKYAMDCIYALGKRTVPLQLVILAELGEVSTFREISSIMLPVYSVTLANVLNNYIEAGDVPDRKIKLKIHFTAPEARVLIVDDIVTNLRVAKELMVPYNMDVHTCSSGAEAVDMVRQSRYDVVFMDHMMPEMDGVEAAARIRAWEQEQSGAVHCSPGETLQGERRQIPIIALTANAVSGQRQLFLEKGFNDFLAKPIDIQKLNDILEKWIPEKKRIETVRPAAETRIEKTAVPVIPGIDAEMGLNNTGGVPDVYLDILEEYCRDAEDRSVKMIDALQNGDVQLLAALAHALKGSSRSVGAVDLGDTAAWLEKSAESENPERVRETTAELVENLRVVIGNIRGVLARRKTGDGQGNSDISGLRLDELKAALASMNMEAVNRLLLEYTSLSLDTETRSKIAEIEDDILLFEYEKAVEKINTLFKKE